MIFSKCITNPPFSGDQKNNKPLYIDCLYEILQNKVKETVAFTPSNLYKAWDIYKNPKLQKIIEHIDSFFEISQEESQENFDATFQGNNAIFTFSLEIINNKSNLLRYNDFIDLFQKIKNVPTLSDIGISNRNKELENKGYTGIKLTRLANTKNDSHFQPWKNEDSINYALNLDRCTDKKIFYFNSKQEAINFYYTNNTLFMRAINIIFQPKELRPAFEYIPYLGNVLDGYKNPWTDERLINYFKISNNLWNRMKKRVAEYESGVKALKNINYKNYPLKEDVKKNILKEFSEWIPKQYANNTFKERQILNQYYTSPEIAIRMLEKFENLDGSILDPTCGCGGLLAAAIMAGADPKKCYGIELDKDILKVCRERLSKLGVPPENLRHGNALNSDCYDFDLKDNETYNFYPNKGPNGTVKIIKNGKEKAKFVFGWRK